METEFDNISLNNSSISNDNENNGFNSSLDKLIVCGKFFAHKLHTKYNFQACDFLIYYPGLKNNIFHSEMLSEDCFTSSLKWNENFFRKIYLALTEPVIKNGYFSIFYERDNTQNKMSECNINYKTKKLEIEINLPNKIDETIEENDIFQDLDLGNDVPIENKNKFLELHFLVDNKDITAFRLLLKEIYDENPINTILKKALEFEKHESNRLSDKQKSFSIKEIEMENLKKSVIEKQGVLEKKRREYMYKFYLLNKEKNKKINELDNSLRMKNNFNDNDHNNHRNHIKNDDINFGNNIGNTLDTLNFSSNSLNVFTNNLQEFFPSNNLSPNNSQSNSGDD